MHELGCHDIALTMSYILFQIQMSVLAIDDELVDEEDKSSDRGMSIYESHANQPM